MLPGYAFDLEACEIFCERCGTSTTHSRAGERHVSVPREGEAPGTILCVCGTCARKSILYDHDFHEFKAADSRELQYKIPGMCRMIVNDSVYLPRENYKGTVISRFRRENMETFTIRLLSGEHFEFEMDKVVFDQKDALESYKLLPEQLPEVRIGERVYHHQLHVAGRVVGIARGPDKEVFIRADDDSLLEIRSPRRPNAKLEAEVLRLLEHRSFRKITAQVDGFNLRVKNGVITVSGTCRSLSTCFKMTREIRKHPEVLGVINEIKIEPGGKVEDRALESAIFRKLMKKRSLGLLDISLDVTGGHVRVWATCRENLHSKSLEQALLDVKGIRSLVGHLSLFPPPTREESEKEEKVENYLKKNTGLDFSPLRVHCLNQSVRLEGCVLSQTQKKAATLAAMWAARDFKIVNNLRVMNEPFPAAT